ncbi:MAG: arylesterase [Bdellovibrionaceae bacterium]|nr:arylesterase [Pseudobdellovibrionaceae bacterium]
MRPLSFFSLFLSLLLPTLVWSAPKKLVILGDSLSEGYGVSREAAFPALLEKKIKADGKDWTVINAGISGSTSASAVSRLKWQLKAKPDLIVVALGANDGLRGLKTEELEKNLSAAIEAIQKEKIPVILAGMMMPPNYTKDYADKFAAVYPRVAKKYKIKLIPFLLDKVAGETALNQADGIHPNEKGHVIVADTVYANIKGQL